MVDDRFVFDYCGFVFGYFIVFGFVVILVVVCVVVDWNVGFIGDWYVWCGFDGWFVVWWVVVVVVGVVNVCVDVDFWY